MHTFVRMLGAIWQQARFALGSLLLCTLLACGGGGGGSSDGSQGATPSNVDANGFSVTLDKSSISFTYQEDAPYASPEVINATPHGPLPKQLYVLATVEGQGISSYIPATFTTSGAQFRISPQSLPAGRYQGRVLLYACSDAQCANPIGGTPIPVAYVVNVLKGLKAAPRINLNAISGQTAAGNVAVQLPDGASTFTARVTQGADWLTAGTPDGATLPISAGSLRSGTYYGSIELTSNGQIITVLVVYDVLPPSGGDHDLLTSPSSLTFGAVENTQTPPQALAIALPTWGGERKDLQYSVQYNGLMKDWLTVTATDTGLSVTASATQLSRGTYTAAVLVSHPSSQASLSIPVAFTVGASMIKPADLSLAASQNTTASSLQGAVAINLLDGTPITWSATSGAAWLKLTRTSGQTGTSIQYAVDIGQLAQVPNYSDIKTTVTVTPSLSHVTPVSFDVTLHKQLAEAQFVGPYLIMAGKPQTVRLRGRGFDGIPASLSAYVDADGLQPTSIKRTNDTQIVLQLPALTAGSYKLSVKNDLNLPADTVNLRVVAPTAFTYGAYPTSGHPYWMVYDAWRKSAFFLNKEAERVQRYQFDGQTWTGTSVSMAAVSNLGMSPDGDSLITITSKGKVSLLSPNTLDTLFQLDAPYGSGETFTYFRLGIPSTNDGRSWMTLGSGWNNLAYFDHRSKTIQILNPAISTSFYSGPWMISSRDGERMIVVQSAAISPQPPMLYMDATDGVLHENPTNLTFAFGLSLSDTGDRLALDGYEVRDAAFGVIGRLATPESNYSPMGSLVSPDGNRTYVLAYPYESTYQADPVKKPRIYVFDSSVAPVNSLYLPVLGYFDLQHYPSCHVSISDDGCSVRMAPAPDGNTLFIVGNQNFIVAPIPALTPVATAASSSNRMTAQSLATKPAEPVSRPQRWPLKSTP